jgi:hypothetical protein
MIALFVVFGAKIGYAWKAAGNLIFPLYYYLMIAFWIDI